LVDIVKNGEAKIKTQHNEVRPFVSFPPDPKLMPPNPILLDIVFSTQLILVLFSASVPKY